MRIVHALLATALLSLSGCLLCSGGPGWQSERDALKMARSLSAERLEAICSQLVSMSEIADFGSSGKIDYMVVEIPEIDVRKIPAGLEDLNASRIRLRRESASIKLWFCVDSGVFLDVSGLDKDVQAVRLWWGDGYYGGNEVLWQGSVKPSEEQLPDAGPSASK